MVETVLNTEGHLDVDAKRLKLDCTETINILNTFEFVKVLNENNLSKLIIIHAHKKDETSENNNAVIIFEKPHFGLDEVKSFLSINNPYETDIQNDIYTKFCIYPLRPFNSKLNMFFNRLCKNDYIF